MTKSDLIEDLCAVCDGTGTDKTKAHAPGGVSAATCQAWGGDSGRSQTSQRGENARPGRSRPRAVLIAQKKQKSL